MSRYEVGLAITLLAAGILIMFLARYSCRVGMARDALVKVARACAAIDWIGCIEAAVLGPWRSSEASKQVAVGYALKQLFPWG